MRLSVENKNVLLVKKPVGKTPFQMVQAVRSARPELQGVKIGYAGRLDPMAEGLLVLLIGEENKKRKSYEDLPKTYEFSLLLGIATDTYDILGKITNKKANPSTISKKVIEKAALEFVGKHIVEYPPYSSAVFKGKPLYFWARKGRLGEVEIPKREIEIFSLEMQGIENMNPMTLRDYIVDRVKMVEGDFRQKEILLGWEQFFKQSAHVFQVVTFKITCSSGTYVRSLCNEIGRALGSCALAYSIKRTKVGEFSLDGVASIKV